MVFCYNSPNRLRPWLNIEITQGTFKSPNAQATSQTNFIRMYGGWRVGLENQYCLKLPRCSQDRVANITFPSIQGTSVPLLLTLMQLG